MGPFLVIGVRMGLIGLKQLDVKQHNKKLSITASLPLRIPFSCIIDGLQVTTHCTIGNQRLSLIDSEKIQARFERKDNGKKIVIALNQSTFKKLESKLLYENMTLNEVQKLAWKVVAIPENELFIIT